VGIAHRPVFKTERIHLTNRAFLNAMAGYEAKLAGGKADCLKGNHVIPY
jgi:hypothetical protein